MKTNIPEMSEFNFMFLKIGLMSVSLPYVVSHLDFLIGSRLMSGCKQV